jgi:riboflavin kinase/FMN adenylyltransferase
VFYFELGLHCIITAVLQVHYDLLNFPKLDCPIVTPGTFDGVHLGHRTILKRLKELAEKSSGQTVVITFEPHPRIVLQPNDQSLELLSTLDEKIRLLAEIGIDHLLVIPFDKAFSELSSDEFIKMILVNAVRTKKLVIGYDHHFGKNREGRLENLVTLGLNYGFEVEEIPARDIDQVAVSSTKIRSALKSSDIETANTFLGYPYQFCATVYKGNQLGRTIGYPTANLRILGTKKLIPKTGVYAVTVISNNSIYKGMLNIGYRPTVLDSGELRLEVHLFDFQGDLYDQQLTVNFHAWVREELKFPDLDQLKEQLHSDKTTVQNLLKSV